MAKVPETRSRRVAGTADDTPEAKEIRHQRALKAAASRKVGRDEKKRVFSLFLEEEESEKAGRRYRLWQQMQGLCEAVRTNHSFNWPPPNATAEYFEEVFAHRNKRVAELPKPKSAHEAAAHFGEVYRPFLVEFLPASKIIELFKSLLTRRRDSISTLWIDNLDPVVMNAVRDKIENYFKSRGAEPPLPANVYMEKKAAERAGKVAAVASAAEAAAAPAAVAAAAPEASVAEPAEADDESADESADEAAADSDYADAVAALTAMRKAAADEIAAMRAAAVAEIAAARAAAVAEITAMMSAALRRPAPRSPVRTGQASPE